MKSLKMWVVFPFAVAVAVMTACSSGGGGGSAPPPPPPVAPTGLTAAAGLKTVTVAWNAVADATSYNLYFARNGAVSKATGTKIASVTSPYQHTMLSAGTYSYIVTAVNAGGESDESSGVSAPVNAIVFVTSTAGDGNMAGWAGAGANVGLAAADAVCNARAAAGGWGGTYRAWLSTATDHAYCRANNSSGSRPACGGAFTPTGPWMRTDGTPFGESIDAIVVQQQVYSPMNRDEFGAEVLSSITYFTGANSYGEFRSAFTSCGDWQNNTTGAAGNGVPHRTSTFWTEYSSSNCDDATNHIVCFEAEAGPALPVTAFTTTGKKVFVTSATGTGDLGAWSGAGDLRGKTGLAAGDAICRNLAATAGLANADNFKAWLSDSATDAKDRLRSNGPWIKLDGIKVADSKADLIDGKIFSSINRTETNTYLNENVWSGSDAAGVKQVYLCSDWTFGTNSSVEGARGMTSATLDWSFAARTACNQSLHLYCFEDEPCTTCRTFVTAATFSGDIRTAGGKATAVASADSLCMADANKPAGASMYKAMLVDGVNRVACTTANCSGGSSEHVDWIFHPNATYLRSDGTTTVATMDANGIWDFGAGGNTNLLTNAFVAAGLTYWTGLNYNWTSTPTQMCGGSWADGTAGVIGDFGNADRIDSGSIGGGSVNCAVAKNLLCIEQ